jgi:hypothetical protein
LLPFRVKVKAAPPADAELGESVVSAGPTTVNGSAFENVPEGPPCRRALPIPPVSTVGMNTCT